MPTSLIKTSFNAGEISKRLAGMVDLARYQNGLRTCLNCGIMPQGGAIRRSGFEYINSAKYSNKTSRLIPFQFSTTQNYVIEVGDYYFRFYMDGGVIVHTVSSTSAWALATSYTVNPTSFVNNGGTVYRCLQAHTSSAADEPGVGANWEAYWEDDDTYEIYSPYSETDISSLKFAQSADTMYLVHPDYNPRKLTRTGHTSWALTSITFTWGPFRDTNTTDTTIDPSGQTGNITLDASDDVFDSDMIGGYFFLFDGYVEITAVASAIQASATVIESLEPGDWEVSTVYTVDQVVWGVNGGDFYRCILGHTSGYVTEPGVGGSWTTYWVKDGKTTEWQEGAWSDYRGYPSAITFFEQRLVFSGSINQPQTVWMSTAGNYEDFHQTDALADDEACIYTLSADQVNAIIWLVSGKRLFVGTTGGEWWVTGATASDAITPTSILIRRDTIFGSADITALPIGNSVLFVQRPGKILRELVYTFQTDSYAGANLSILAEHLTDQDKTIAEMAYQQTPYAIIWCVRSDGVLLGLTYMREHEVVGWHRHTTGASGLFKSVTSIPGTYDDEVWVIVERTIDGSTVKYVERLKPWFDDDDTEDAFFVDSGLTYSGSATSTITGLDHLEGETVKVLGDGAVLPDETVSGGQITLDQEVEAAQVGLGYNSDIETLALEAPVQGGTIQGRTKRFNRLTLRLWKTIGIKVGKSFDDLEIIPFRQVGDDMDASPDLFTGDKELPSMMYDWNKQGRIYIRQSQPLPMTVLALIPEVTVH